MGAEVLVVAIGGAAGLAGWLWRAARADAAEARRGLAEARALIEALRRDADGVRRERDLLRDEVRRLEDDLDACDDPAVVRERLRRVLEGGS